MAEGGKELPKSLEEKVSGDEINESVKELSENGDELLKALSENDNDKSVGRLSENGKLVEKLSENDNDKSVEKISTEVDNKIASEIATQGKSETKNPVKIRGGHVSQLKVLYNKMERLLVENPDCTQLVDLETKIERQFQKYVNCHFECVETENTKQLIENHDLQLNHYQLMRNKLKQAIQSKKVESVKVKKGAKSHGKSSHSSRSSASKLLESKVKTELKS